MTKHGYYRFTQMFYLSLSNTGVHMLFLFELSCILHIRTLLQAYYIYIFYSGRKAFSDFTS